MSDENQTPVEEVTDTNPAEHPIQASMESTEVPAEEVVHIETPDHPIVVDQSVTQPIEVLEDGVFVSDEPKPRAKLGDVVMYTAGADDSELYGRNLAAIVVCTYEDSNLYNLAVFTPWGAQIARVNVPFQMAHTVRPDTSYFMPKD